VDCISDPQGIAHTATVDNKFPRKDNDGLSRGHKEQTSPSMTLIPLLKTRSKIGKATGSDYTKTKGKPRGTKCQRGEERAKPAPGQPAAKKLKASTPPKQKSPRTSNPPSFSPLVLSTAPSLYKSFSPMQPLQSSLSSSTPSVSSTHISHELAAKRAPHAPRRRRLPRYPGPQGSPAGMTRPWY
jgi:hypothetical protein